MNNLSHSLIVAKTCQVITKSLHNRAFVTFCDKLSIKGDIYEKMGKGITLSKEELKSLRELLNNMDLE